MTELIDLHLHPGWTDFFPQEREARSPAERAARIALFLKKYRENGVVLARDAGGFEGPQTDACPVLLCAGMITGANYGDAAFFESLCRAPGAWVKLFVTGGVGAPTEAAAAPLIPEKAVRRLIRALRARGKKVMVHCWGGPSLDWCAEEGVDTLEHGVFMTETQAAILAEKGIPLIPTCCVYRLLAEEPALFGIGPEFLEHAKRACEGQARAIRFALRQGVTIGYGTDFYADPALAPYARRELDALREYGLSEAQALAAGTSVARRILGFPAEG